MKSPRTLFSTIAVLSLIVSINTTRAFSEEPAPGPSPKPEAPIKQVFMDPIIAKVEVMTGGSQSSLMTGGRLVFDPPANRDGTQFNVKMEGLVNDHANRIGMQWGFFKQKSKDGKFEFEPLSQEVVWTEDRAHSSYLNTVRAVKLSRIHRAKMGEKLDLKASAWGALASVNQEVIDGNDTKKADGLGANLGAEVKLGGPISEKDALELRLSAEVIAALSNKLGPVHKYEGDLLWSRAIRDSKQAKVFAGVEANSTDFTVDGKKELNHFAGIKTGILY